MATAAGLTGGVEGRAVETRGVAVGVANELVKAVRTSWVVRPGVGVGATVMVGGA